MINVGDNETVSAGVTVLPQSVVIWIKGLRGQRCRNSRDIVYNDWGLLISAGIRLNLKC